MCVRYIENEGIKSVENYLFVSFVKAYNSCVYKKLNVNKWSTWMSTGTLLKFPSKNILNWIHQNGRRRKS